MSATQGRGWHLLGYSYNGRGYGQHSNHSMDQRNLERGPWAAHFANLEEALLRNFVSKPRQIPARPSFSRNSTIIIRKQVLPFYFAIYDHDLQRFVELQYRHAEGGPLETMLVPADMQPPLTGEEGPTSSGPH